MFEGTGFPLVALDFTCLVLGKSQSLLPHTHRCVPPLFRPLSRQVIYTGMLDYFFLFFILFLRCIYYYKQCCICNHSVDTCCLSDNGLVTLRHFSVEVTSITAEV